MKKLALALLLVCLLAPAPVRAEQEIPSLDLSGLMDVLAKNRDHVVLLNFFATWCPPCRVEIPDLIAAHELYKDKKIVIIGLSVDEEKAKLPAFIKRNRITYPVYHINATDVARVYGIRSIPHNAFYAMDGTLVISEPGVLDAATLKMVVDKLLTQK